VTGDVIQDDSAGAYEHFVELLRGLDLPVYALPGNHDVRALMREALDAPKFHYCKSVAGANWLIVSLDSCVSGQAGGHVAAAELARLDREIEATDADHVMVCLHHPPVDVGSRWLDSVGLDNADEVVGRVSVSGKVRLVVFGHVHQPYDDVRRGLRIMGTPSTCRQFAQGSALFAVDDRPPAYRRINLRSDGSIDQTLVWLST